MAVPRKYRKLFQDAIVVEIPLDVTADLGVAIKHTREKRIASLYKHFPSLKKKAPPKDDAAASGQEQEGSEKDDEEPLRKKQKPNLHQPLRDQYGSVLDYLEAKYVRGVMVPESEEDEEEDKGSIYSETSFLDDTQLKRDLAEQVLATATQTKVEVEDEDDFFVNVGTLEVEDHELMDYDPLEEEPVAKKESSAKKRKKPTIASMAKSVKSPASSKTMPQKKKPKKMDDGKSLASTKSDASNTKSAASKKKPSQKPPRKSEAEKVLLKQEAASKKKAWEEVYARLCEYIKGMTDEELPRKNPTAKVSVIVPQGKMPGDPMMFSNPHIPGQKLKVKVPKGIAPGAKFVVSVPKETDTSNTENKFSLEFREILDEYSNMYDEWCHAEAQYCEATPEIKEKFALNKEKIGKFDKLLKEFPADLVKPIDVTILRKFVRQVRQNRWKRQRREDTDVGAKAVVGTKKEEEMNAAPKKEEVAIKGKGKTMELLVPGKGRAFPKLDVKSSDFEV